MNSMNFAPYQWLTRRAQGLAILTFALLTGCASYPSEEGAVHAQPLGDVLKCADAGNQHLPTCYCHSLALKDHPSRQNICSASLDGWLKEELQGVAPRSVEFVHKLRTVTAELEQVQKDRAENWSDKTEQYLSGEAVLDDCDAVDSLLDIVFTLGGFRLDELAKVLVDSNPNDARPADHYVAAVWVEGEWLMLDFFTDRPQPLLNLEFGGYLTKTGNVAGESRVVAYRRLNQTEWRHGLPPRGPATLVASL